MKTKIPVSARQGDVLLLEAAYVGGIPKDAVLQKLSGRKIILAFGEATGHHHRFEFMDTSENVKLYVAAGGARYLHVETPNPLLHEEHVQIPADLAVGKWLLPSQVEYTAKELVRVQD
jgi:hypothetical protein